MRKYLVYLFVIGAILACIASITIIWGRSYLHYNSRREMQENLAKELGVNIEDYPYQLSFPVGYFYTILQPGMTIVDVHKIIQGYEKVLHCSNSSEIYYYFSSELKDAKRFKIIYDGQGNFVRLEGEEDDSRTLQIDGCEPGQIK